MAWLGDDIVAADGSIDRSAVGQRVFGDSHSLVHLTQLLWPAIFERVRREIERSDDGAVVVVEAALLAKAGWHIACDQVCTVLYRVVP